MSDPRRILLIDTEASHAERVKTALDQFEVLRVAGQAEQDRALVTGAFDLTLINDPPAHADSLDILSTLKTRFPARPVLLLVAEGREEIYSQGIHAGLDGGLLKRDDYLKLLPRTLELALKRAHDEALPQGFDRFVDAVSDAMYRYRPAENTVDFVTASFQDLTGYSTEEFRADPVGLSARLPHPDDRERIKRAVIRHAFQSRAVAPISVDYRLVRKDGSLVWVNETIDLELDENRQVLAVNGVCRDVTEQREAEEALRESEQKFVRFASLVDDVLYRSIPQENRYDYISPSFETLTGIPVEKLLEDPYGVMAARMPESDLERNRQAFNEHVARGPDAGPLTLEYRIRRQDERWIWVSETVTVEFDEDGRPFQVNGVIRDITTRVEARRLQAESQAELVRAQRMEGLVLAAEGTAMELRHLRDALVSFQELARDAEDAESPLAAGVARLRASVQTSLDMVRQLLNLSLTQMDESDGADPYDPAGPAQV